MTISGKVVRLALVGYILAAALLIESAQARTIELKWTSGKLRAKLPKTRHHMINPGKKIMKVCSGDVVHFKWSGEQMGLYGFYTANHYRKCHKGDLNYMKNTRSWGSFKTKPNNSGWRYYAYITGAGDGACKYGCGHSKNKSNKISGTCKQKLAIYWSTGC